MGNYHFSHISLWYFQQSKKVYNKKDMTLFWKQALLKRAYRYFSEYGYLLN